MTKNWQLCRFRLRNILQSYTLMQIIIFFRIAGMINNHFLHPITVYYSLFDLIMEWKTEIPSTISGSTEKTIQIQL